MRNKYSLYGILLGCLLVLSCSHDNDEYVLLAEEGEHLSGGVSTVNNASEEAFGFSSSVLTPSQQIAFGVGNSFFRQSWVSAPSSTTARDGLGPILNAVSCSSCHFKDGRGRPPVFEGELGEGLLLRLSVAGTDNTGASLPEPTYGHQLQDASIMGVDTEGDIKITYTSFSETLADGTVVTLKKPIYSITNLAYGPIDSGVLISPRIANQMVGLGLLEAIDENTILSYVDETDMNGDGISGKANYVYDIESKTQKLGRFGWKANQPSIKQQVAAAFAGDLGITSYLFPDENCPPNINCNDIPNGGTPEITDANFDKVVLYSQSLAVPVRRDYEEQHVLNGKEIFKAIQCAACHIPKMQTGSNYHIDGFRNETIRPYTDLLLHDMGEALSDNSPDFLANGREWRTQPLWGIGLIQTVNGHTQLLHDGRANNITEAILWHGGEAQQSKNLFKTLSTEDREDLLAFINSL